jgi:hypothetical protein
MSWINKHRRVWGFVILALLLMAGMGPWGFDVINVPAQFSCSAPFIRLKGDFCGEPVSGVRGLSALLGDLVVGTVTGRVAFIDLGHIFLVILYVLIVLLPVISAVLWISTGRHQHQSIFHLAAWGLATIFIWFGFSVRLLTVTSQFHPGQLWGLWLYTGLVTTVLILEVVTFAIRGWSNQAR